MRIHGLGAHPFLSVSPKRARIWKSRLGVYISRQPFSLKCARTHHKDQFPHICGVDAEPLHRYCKGGYHPIRLGDLLKDGRYKIMHKLGWGGWSTVWAARDQNEHRYVAVKVSVSERGERDRESKVLRAIAAIRAEQHPGSRHVVQMLDHFQLDGPNGTHSCVVLELLGPSVPDLLSARFRDERLPGTLAKAIAKQALLGLAYLHEHKIGHGDMHTRNLAFTIPDIHALTEEAFFQKLGNPETGLVRRKDGKPLEPGMPEYVVRPTSYPAARSISVQPVKIVDFGESFTSDDGPETLHTPLAVRAPEVVFGEKMDCRGDLWSMGCLLFELVTGQPPFDTMITPTVLVRQMLEMAADELPARWQDTWRAMDSASPGEKSGYALQEWLEECYFDGERKEELTKEDVRKVGGLVQRMLHFEPSERAAAKEMLEDSWFKDE